jgi:hypothetical protein
MQSVIDAHVQRSNQVEEFYMECLEESMGRIKRSFGEEQSTSMILKLGEVAGLKGILPPHSMHDLVKIVRIGLEKAGVRVHRCRDPHHLKVEWGAALRQSTRPQVRFDKQTKTLEHAIADGGPRYVFNGDRCAQVPMLDALSNPSKCY